VTRNFWSADRADIALEVAEARYRYVDDVAIIDWRPFQAQPDVVWQFDTQHGERPRLQLRRAQSVLTLELSTALAPLAAWLSTRSEAFGLNDIEVCELSSAAREDAPRLLLALARHGFLRVDDYVQQALAAIYGEVPMTA
jgi:hypothetical protein